MARRVWQTIDPQIPVCVIDDFAAGGAYQMMMPLHVAVEASGRGEMVRAPCQPEIGEGFQSAVNRRPGNSGKALLYDPVHLVHGRVVGALNQRLENDAALHGSGNPVSPARRFESRKRGACFGFGWFQAVHTEMQ